MHRSPFSPRACVLALTFASLWACSPAPQSPAPQAPAPKPVVATPPAKKAVMICRNSQTGAKAECGTANAVMVGIKTD